MDKIRHDELIAKRDSGVELTPEETKELDSKVVATPKK